MARIALPKRFLPLSAELFVVPENGLRLKSEGGVLSKIHHLIKL
jgi:hypothetical protein